MNKVKTVDFKKSHKLGYVYAIKLGSGAIKIGRTARDPSIRIAEHSHTARLMGSFVDDSVVSGLIIDSDIAEQHLLELFTINAGQLAGKEWFGGGDFNLLRLEIEREYSGDSSEKLTSAVKRNKDIDKAVANVIFDKLKIKQDSISKKIYLFDEMDIGGDKKNELLTAISAAGGKELYDWASYNKMGCPAVTFITKMGVYCAYPGGLEVYENLTSYLKHHEDNKLLMAIDIGCSIEDLAGPLEFSIDISTTALEKEYSKLFNS